MMNILPWIGFAIAVALLSVKNGSDQRGEPPSWREYITPIVLMLIGAAACAGIGSGLGGILVEHKWGFFGLAVGLAFPVLLALLEQRDPDPSVGRLIPIGFAVAAAGWLRLVALPDTFRAQVGVIVGAAVGALMLRSGSGARRPEWPLGWALALAFVVAAGLLGQMALGDKAGETGVVLGLAVLVASVLGWGIGKGSKSNVDSLGPAVSTALVVLAGWLLSQNYFAIPELGWVVTSGAVCALAVAWLLPEDRNPSAFSLLLSSTLWLGIGTFAFAQLKGFGMASALLPAGLLLIGMGRKMAIASAAPLFALVLYRLFREQYVDASRALDIGQHYAIVGFMIGLMLVLGLVEWMESRDRRDGVFSSIASALAGLLCLYLLLGSVVLLGAKGAVGLLIGLGVAPLVAALGHRRSYVALVWSLGLIGFLTLSYGALAEHIDLDREAKVGFVVQFVVIAVIGALAVRLLSGKAKEVQS